MAKTDDTAADRTVGAAGTSAIESLASVTPMALKLGRAMFKVVVHVLEKWFSD